jgi:ribosome maturation factor RimP
MARDSALAFARARAYLAAQSRHCDTTKGLAPKGAGTKRRCHMVRARSEPVADIARITALVEPEAQALGFDLVRVRFYKGGDIGPLSDAEEFTLQIMAERPETGQLVIEDCAALSRRISDAIDALEEKGDVLIHDAYRLEVSSPGIDRPLTRPKDFANWAGHEARITLTNPVAVDSGADRKSLQGDLIGIDGDTVTLEDKKSGRVSFPYADIQSAKLVLTDKLIAATRPLETAGADEIVEEQED